MAEVYTCPSRSSPATINGAGELQNPNFHYILDHTSLDKLSALNTGETVLMSDMISNHNNYGAALYGGGHVIGYPGAEWYSDSDITTEITELVDGTNP